MNIDLTRLTEPELKNLLANNERLGQTDKVCAVVQEMARRGAATQREYRLLNWNQDRVRDEMQRFKNVAESVKENRRTAYMESGGRKIGRSKDHPQRMWIDAYSAIRTSAINAVFVCYVKRPGKDPKFQLKIDGKYARSFSADPLLDALAEWRNRRASHRQRIEL